MFSGHTHANYETDMEIPELKGLVKFMRINTGLSVGRDIPYLSKFRRDEVWLLNQEWTGYALIEMKENSVEETWIKHEEISSSRSLTSFFALVSALVALLV